jgi:hypothetical protein
MRKPVHSPRVHIYNFRFLSQEKPNPPWSLVLPASYQPMFTMYITDIIAAQEPPATDGIVSAGKPRSVGCC